MPIRPPTPAATAIRRLAAVRRVVRDWRALTSSARAPRAGPGAPTLVACSGGADSCALALALADARARIVVGHVVHDLRPEADALADRDAARELAARLSLEFVERRIAVRLQGGNAEGAARLLRYAALVEMARQAGVGHVATAHHAHDQVESVLMHLVRGAGPAGLAGIAPRRRYADLWIIRPMLGIGPGEARAICTAAGWAWREDATNADTSRLRAAIRHTVLPALLATRPGAAQRIADAATMQRYAARFIRGTASRLAATSWPRHELRRLAPIVLGELLRSSVPHPDSVPARSILAAIRLVRSNDTDPHTLPWRGAQVKVTAHTVSITAVSG